MGDPRDRSDRTRPRTRESLPVEDAVRLCLMNSTFGPASTVNVDTARPAVDDRPAAHPLLALATVRMPVDARGLALGVLAVLALIFALSWAEKFLVPLLLGIVIAYTLNPLVVWLEAIKIPRVVGTVMVMASVIGALVLGTYSLRGEMQAIIEQLPEAAGKVSTAIERVRIGQLGNMQKIQNAATEVEKATTQAAVGPASSASARHSRHRGPRPRSSSATSCGRVRWAPSERWVRRRWWSSWCSSCCSAAINSNASWCG